MDSTRGMIPLPLTQLKTTMPMKSLFFPCALLLPLAATSSLHAQEPPSARLEVQHGSNLILRGDWLYWQANETGLSFALQQEGFEPENPEPMGFGHVVNPDFSWHSGFRLGLGFNIPHDQWDANLLWTNYEGKALGHAKTNSDELLYPSFIHPLKEESYPIIAIRAVPAQAQLKIGKGSSCMKRVAISNRHPF